MSATQPFSPHQGSNQVVVLGAAAPTPITVDKNDKNIRLANSGANPVHYRAYSSLDPAPPVATVNDTVVLPNMVGTFTKSMSQDRVSLFSTLGTTVHVCTGEGW